MCFHYLPYGTDLFSTCWRWSLLGQIAGERILGALDSESDGQPKLCPRRSADVLTVRGGLRQLGPLFLPLKTRLPLVLLLATLLMGAIGISLVANSTPPQAPQHQEIGGVFRILRGPPETARSGADRRSLKSLSITAPGESLESAQLAVEHSHLWVLSTERFLCLAQPKGSACTPKNMAIRAGVLLGTFQPPTKEIAAPHNFLLQGLVPDDVRRVQVIIGRDHLRIVNVTSNVFSIERDQPVHLKRLLRS